MTPVGPLPFDPKPGFRWSKVIWGRPDAIVSPLCSYCSASFTDDEVPLILFQPDGHTAKFCTDCQKTWWGMVSFDDDNEPDDG